jgi:hypothetical protein
MLFHAAINNTKDIVPSAAAPAATPFGLNASPVAWIGAALLWAFAAFFLAWMARTEPRRAGRYADLPAEDAGAAQPARSSASVRIV